VIRLALGAVRDTSVEMLRYAVQLGYEQVVVNTPRDVPGVDRWDVADLRAMKERVEAHGLQIAAIENTPMSFYADAITNGPGVAQQVENYKQTIKAIGEIGVPILGFHWMANDVWRSNLALLGRGGVRLTEFDYSKLDDPDRLTHGRVYGREEMWTYFRNFMDEVLPVAENSGVRLALHPDDPPVDELGGIPRLFSSHQRIRDVVDIYGGNPAFGLEFCLGTVSEMGEGADRLLFEMIKQNAVAYIHFRDVKGYVPQFHESFLGEGNLDVVAVLRTLLDLDFQGFLIDDHVPLLDGDPEIVPGYVNSPYAFRGRAYANGYLQGMVKALTTT
jgi:mannonate dehydratase